MKAFLCNGRVLKVLSVIFVLSLLMGLFVPFSALELPEEDGDAAAGEVINNENRINPYVIFDAEYIRDNIPATNQGNVAYIEEDPAYVEFTPDYQKPIDPSFTFAPAEAYSAEVYKYVSIVIRAEMAEDTTNFWMYYVAGRDGAFKGGEYVVKGYAKTNGWQVVTFDLSSATEWKGDIKKLRFDVCNTEHPGTFDVAAIIFSETPQAVYDGAFEALMGMFKPEQVISDFNEGEEIYFSSESSSDMINHNTKVTVRDGNVLLEGADALSDPYIGFMYKGLMEARGVDESEWLTTADFNNTVVRFRAGNVGSPTVFELFLFTGDNYQPFRIPDGKGGEKFASTSCAYRPTTNNGWQCLSLKMDAAKCAEGWTGDFNGFRIDWCSHSETGGCMEITDIAFFADDAAAAAVIGALNTVTLPLPKVSPTDRPFLTPLDKDSGWIVLAADEVNGKIVDSENVTHAVNAVNGKKSVLIKTTNATNQAYVEMNVKGIDIDNHRYLSVLVKRKTASLENFIVYYKSDGGEYQANSGTAAAYDSLDGWQVLTFLFDEGAFTDGHISSLRLNFAGGRECNVGDGCEIAAMVFSKSGEEAYDAAYYLLNQVYVPVQILNNFTASDVAHFETATSGVTTQVSASDGNLVYSSTAAGRDPGKMFSYTSYAAAKGITPVTTIDFRYTVVRYRSQGIGAGDATMEMFILTGDAQSLFDMATIYEKDPNTGATIKLECRHCARANYVNNTQQAWRSVVLDMATGDGYETSTNLKYGWYREDGNYTFNGFRLDWCLATGTSSMLQISDIIFFQDKDDAAAMSAALNAVTIPVHTVVVPDDDDDFPFDDELGSETDDLETDTENEEETFPELEDSDNEEIPVFTDTEEDSSKETGKEENSEDVSQGKDDESESEESASDDIDTDESSSGETENVTEESGSHVNTESETESAENSEHEGAGIGGIGDIPDTDNGAGERDEGSQLPFYLACGAMVILSIASILAVTIIKAKIAREEKRR